MPSRLPLTRPLRFLPGLPAPLLASLAALLLSLPAAAIRPALPDWCQQSNPSASYACEFATALDPGFLVPNMTGDSLRCKPLDARLSGDVIA